jgi:hypothetical protein
VLDADDLLDRDLVDALGPFRPDVVHAMVGVCIDALAATVGPRILAELRADRQRLPLVAPWVSDLARGLLVLERFGPRELSSSQLLDLLARHRLDDLQRALYARTVDLTATLTLDRVVEHVLGPGACGRDPQANAISAPWLAALTYGHRIHIALELLRILPDG